MLVEIDFRVVDFTKILTIQIHQLNYLIIIVIIKVEIVHLFIPNILPYLVDNSLNNYQSYLFNNHFQDLINILYFLFNFGNPTLIFHIQFNYTDLIIWI